MTVGSYCLVQVQEGFFREDSSRTVFLGIIKAVDRYYPDYPIEADVFCTHKIFKDVLLKKEEVFPLERNISNTRLFKLAL